MALPQFTVEDLIANIKRRCSVPTSQLTFTDEDFSLLANDTLQGEVVPLIMSTREEFFVEHVDIPMPSNRIIPLPVNTIGSKVRSVAYLQSGSPEMICNIPRLDLDTVAGVGPADFGFMIQGNNLVFYPNVGVLSNSTIRIYFYRRTLALAEPTMYGRVISIDAGTNSMVLDYIPTSWAIGTTLNSVSSIPGFETTSSLFTISGVSSPSITVDSVEGISVGDYIADEGFSGVPQVPVEAHAYLAQLTAAKCLESLGDREGMVSAERKAEKLKDNLLTMISQRVDGSVKKVVNASGGLRIGAGIRNRRGGSGF